MATTKEEPLQATSPDYATFGCEIITYDTDVESPLTVLSLHVIADLLLSLQDILQYSLIPSIVQAWIVLTLPEMLLAVFL